jgi:hypothetical protein
VERGVAQGERRTRVVGQHEYGGVERGLVAPPAAPVVIVPGAALRMPAGTSGRPTERFLGQRTADRDTANRLCVNLGSLSTEDPNR